jgi:hypothetical protein
VKVKGWRVEEEREGGKRKEEAGICQQRSSVRKP